ncbi:hypothetical protein K493DRAFT_315638 [Basidiobolus meristosporus CBS 931.73]|uniref:Peptidase S9 prolyl oligopeptidase catalytic domain-containing protein n=1 Tax=Basidiobolus meristosporus CBS 931.73 TaxID=1314790 RepID=A0A1Y1Y8C9_9FUNG|nr:hypothetical protein K493DRAFT_315638 [Basidiobolus meristosporus CBS 931.73]|eukprot:ORX94125.1 hypothetical protein K493DRAFT_315638 [Basidiobolus meristosporus CBS 931.73]
MLFLEPKFLSLAIDGITYDENPITNIIGVIGIEGIYDIPKLVEDYPNYQDWFVEAACTEDKEKWKCYSPQYQAPSNLQPLGFLLIHSPDDELINEKQAISFKEKLEKFESLDVRLDTDISGKHDEMLSTEEVARKMISFCNSLQR